MTVQELKDDPKNYYALVDEIVDDIFSSVGEGIKKAYAIQTAELVARGEIPRDDLDAVLRKITAMVARGELSNPAAYYTACIKRMYQDNGIEWGSPYARNAEKSVAREAPPTNGRTKTEPADKRQRVLELAMAVQQLAAEIRQIATT